MGSGCAARYEEEEAIDVDGGRSADRDEDTGGDSGGRPIPRALDHSGDMVDCLDGAIVRPS